MTTRQSNGSVFIGIDLGGTTLKGALVSPAGEIIQETRIESEQQSPDALFNQLVQAALALRDNENARGKVGGIGVGIAILISVTIVLYRRLVGAFGV